MSAGPVAFEITMSPMYPAGAHDCWNNALIRTGSTVTHMIRTAGVDIIVYPMHELWLDAGRADDLERAQERYSTNFQTEMTQ